MIKKIEKYSPEWYKLEGKRVKDLFYKYSKIPRDKKLTMQDINDEKLRALDKVGYLTGYQEAFIIESLLDEEE